jgi:hypothetical protein
MKNMTNIPDSKVDLLRFENLIKNRLPFTFVRFSDGEVEILRNRPLIINNGMTYFRGRTFRNNFHELDSKKFNPSEDSALRFDLLLSAQFKAKNYFKGVPTSSNNAVIDRDYLLSLNGGLSSQMTFADLLMNSNFRYARAVFFPELVKNSFDLIVVGNWRTKLSGYLANARIVQVADNFFSDYESTRDSVFRGLEDAAFGSTILSSASSLSNILGHKLILTRPDITFIDIGTALNDLMGLPFGTRAYHRVLNPRGVRQKLASLRYCLTREYRMKW